MNDERHRGPEAGGEKAAHRWAEELADPVHALHPLHLASALAVLRRIRDDRQPGLHPHLAGGTDYEAPQEQLDERMREGCHQGADRGEQRPG